MIRTKRWWVALVLGVAAVACNSPAEHQKASTSADVGTDLAAPDVLDADVADATAPDIGADLAPDLGPDIAPECAKDAGCADSATSADDGPDLATPDVLAADAADATALDVGPDLAPDLGPDIAPECVNDADCADNNACTTDTCIAMFCVHGAVSCDDGKACTGDTCDVMKGCQNVDLPETVACDDLDVCTVGDACAGGVCLPGTTTDCSDSDACTTDSCVPATGCAHEAMDANDGDGCTTDSCDPSSGVQHASVVIDDNNACTLDTCDAQTGVSHVLITVSDGDACTKDACDPATGISHTAATGPACDDSDPCTTDDACTGGTCGGVAKSCEDADACTSDACGPAGACTHLDISTGCADGNVCTADSCKPVGGCAYANADGACDLDDTACTPDVCVQGLCVAATAVDCDDKNECTTDACAAATGACTHVNLTDAAACSDGDACTLADACLAGVCKAGAPKSCGSGETCIAGICTPDGMVLIPGGTFWMGCNSAKDANCQTNEGPQHKVTLSPYFMDLTETTVAQYYACANPGTCVKPAKGAYATWGVSGMQEHPVNWLSQDQSQQFCKWRGAGFDLPTEAQWEMAARGDCAKNGSSANDPACKTAMRTYPWGEAAPSCTLAVWNDVGAGCSGMSTGAVASKAAGDSPYGLHDMAGNVSEWTRDRYGYYPWYDQTDPTGPASGGERVYRGGSFYDAAGAFRTSQRFSAFSTHYGYDLGFRCVRSYP